VRNISDKLWKKDWFEWILKKWLILPLSLLFIGWFITLMLANASQKVSFAIGFIWGLLGLMCEIMLIVNKKIREDISKEIDEFKKTLEARTYHIIEPFAIGTKEEKFEKILKKLHDHNLGNLRWALAKFISHRLYRSFEKEDKEIVIEDVSVNEYSELLSELLSESRRSIYFTCPYTPEKWFKILNFDICNTCLEPKNCQREKVMLHEIKSRANHLIEFLNSSVAEKIRILNVKNTSFFVKENLKCIENFVTYYDDNVYKKLTKDHNILIKVISQRELNPRNEEALIRIVDDDFNILDEKLVMMWDEDPNKPSHGVCRLILNPSDVDKYLKIFQNNKNPDDRDIDKIIDKLNS